MISLKLPEARRNFAKSIQLPLEILGQIRDDTFVQRLSTASTNAPIDFANFPEHSLHRQAFMVGQARREISDLDQQVADLFVPIGY